jgi:uncharacterized protein YndB with AHSA1/START domain
MTTIRKDVYLDASVPDTWTALTDPKALAEWLMPNDFKPVVGHRFRFHVDPMGSYSGITECEVLEVEPPTRLVYTWTSVPKDSSRPRPPAMTLIWTVAPEGNGSRLTLEQRGLETLSFFWRLSMRHGWKRMMGTHLPKVVRNVRGGEFTPGAIVKRDYGITTVPENFAK